MSAQPPRVLVLVRPDRVEEGLRMASALPLADSTVEIGLLCDRLVDSEALATHLETIRDFEVPIWAQFTDARVTTLAASDLVAKLPDYDHVLTF